MHDDVKDASIVQMLKQADAVTAFHFEPATEVGHEWHKPVLHTAPLEVQTLKSTYY